MPWTPLLAWLISLAVAAVVLGFCVYDVTWKARRLQGDLRELQLLGNALDHLHGDLVAARQRLARPGVR